MAFKISFYSFVIQQHLYFHCCFILQSPFRWENLLPPNFSFMHYITDTVYHWNSLNSFNFPCEGEVQLNSWVTSLYYRTLIFHFKCSDNVNRSNPAMIFLLINNGILWTPMWCWRSKQISNGSIFMNVLLSEKTHKSFGNVCCVRHVRTVSQRTLIALLRRVSTVVARVE